MARLRLPRVLVVAALVMVTGCSLVTSFSDLSGGSIDEPEAGSKPGGESDAGEAGSRALDGGPVSETGASDPCSEGVFCDGFERTELRGPWDEVAGSKGQIAISNDGARSGSSFLRVFLPSQDFAGRALHRRFPAAKTVKMSFSVRVDRLPARNINVGAIDYVYSDHAVGVFFVFDNGYAKLAEQRAPDNTFHVHATRPLPRERWVELSIAVDHTTTPQRVTATFDGETIAQDVELKLPIPAQELTVIAGSDYAAAGPDVTLDVDDVRVETTPL